MAESRAWVLLLLSTACSGSTQTVSGNTDAGAGETGTGQNCSNASQCFPQLDASALQGVTCLTQGVPSGYCTNTCTSVTDCCKVPGECATATPMVCAPFESTGQMYCFLSCAPEAIAINPAAGTKDPTTYCQRVANPSFACRSTGGGSGNQQACVLP
jgi:hypothetical protein